MRTLNSTTALLALVACTAETVTDAPSYPDISVDAAADLVAAGGDVSGHVDDVAFSPGARLFLPAR